MLVISRETQTGLIATVWDIKEIQVINSITTLHFYGFWDNVHFDKYNNGLVQSPADVKVLQIQRDDDPLSIVDADLGIQINSWIAEGKSLRKIYKRLYEDFIMSVEPFATDWSTATQEWS